MDEKVKVLLCEDDENLGMLLKEYLHAKGYDVDLKLDGEEGGNAFFAGKYDVCVFDVMMPKKDGFTLAQEIRQVNEKVPILFLTAKTLKEDIVGASASVPMITLPNLSAWRSCCSVSRRSFAVSMARRVRPILFRSWASSPLTLKSSCSPSTENQPS